jgi:hypothetical protein
MKKHLFLLMVLLSSCSTLSKYIPFMDHHDTQIAGKVVEVTGEGLDKIGEKIQQESEEEEAEEKATKAK